MKRSTKCCSGLVVARDVSKGELTYRAQPFPRIDLSLRWSFRGTHDKLQGATMP